MKRLLHIVGLVFVVACTASLTVGIAGAAPQTTKGVPGLGGTAYDANLEFFPVHPGEATTPYVPTPAQEAGYVVP
jgi:hypothetical protein